MSETQTPHMSSARKSKKRDRSPAAAASSSSGDTPVLEGAETPGWGELTATLGTIQRCPLLSDEQLAALPTPQGNAVIGRYAELGGSVVRLLLQSLELHRTLSAQTESASFLARQRAEPATLSAADLIARPTSDALGAPLAAMQLPLYDRLAPAQQLGCLKYVQALAAADRDDAGGEGGESDEDGDGTPAAGAGDAGRAFRDLYMEVLAEGCGDELDALRREGGRDPAADGGESLSFLIDALEVGAETFSATEKQLALASYRSPMDAAAAAGTGAGAEPNGGDARAPGSSPPQAQPHRRSAAKPKGRGRAPKGAS